MNRQIQLVSHPKGPPDLSHFKLQETPLPQLQDNDVLIKSIYLSVDPYMRGRLGGRISSHTPFPLNKPLNGCGIGRVVESKSSQFLPGDIVSGWLDWADYSILQNSDLQKIDPNVFPITTWLHALGMTGMTAYFGILDNGQPKKGETVVVSGAAGAVGIIVGQIAKILGCRVVGITGSQEKCSYLVHELGFDAAVNYKNSNFENEIKNACPQGVDVYFDNVGGIISDLVLKYINKHARIALCGQISTYNLENPDIGQRHFRTLIVKSAQARGFIVYDYKERYLEAIDQMSLWIKQGKIKCPETLVKGLENMPQAFLGLFTGDNIGKQLVQIEV
jgi:NADPH:quinone reductase